MQRWSNVILSRGAVSLALMAVASGCAAKLGQVEVNLCAVERSENGKHEAMLAPELIENGNNYLEGALRELPRAEIRDVETPLQRSSECFARALRLSPDNYDAQLSMGITYLAQAQLVRDDSAERASLLQGARHMFGRAYMLRHGAYEPLYYLAVVAVAEGDLVTARRFLEPLRVAEAKAGPVNALLGVLSERDGKMAEAQAFYRKAVAAGWPAETLKFAAARLDQLRAGVFEPRRGG